MNNLTKWNDFQGNNPLINLIKKYPDKEWFWYYISSNRNITWEIIDANPDATMGLKGISKNPNSFGNNSVLILIKPWDWYNISQNPNITWETIESNLDKYWNWK